MKEVHLEQDKHRILFSHEFYNPTFKLPMLMTIIEQKETRNYFSDNNMKTNANDSSDNNMQLLL